MSYNAFSGTDTFELSEQCIFNALIFDEYSRDEIVSSLTKEHFSIAFHKRSFELAVSDFNQGKDLLSEDWLKKFPPPNKPLKLHWKAAILYLQDRKIRQDLFTNSKKLSNEILQGMATESLEETVSLINSSLSGDNAVNDKTIKELVLKYDNEELQQNIPWGMGSLADFKMEPGNLVIIGARPSIGKTSIACTLLLQMAKIGMGVGIINLEMTERQITNRLISQESEIQYSDVVRRQFNSRGEADNYTKAQKSLSELNIMTVNHNNCTASKIKTTVKKWSRVNNTKVVFIDYLQKISMPKAERHDLGIGFLTSMLKDLAISLDIVIILLVQLNRDAENKIPKLNNLKDSGRIEEDADIVILLHRDRSNSTEKSAIPCNDCNETTLLIEKNRNGFTGSRKIQFLPDVMGFFG